MFSCWCDPLIDCLDIACSFSCTDECLPASLFCCCHSIEGIHLELCVSVIDWFACLIFFPFQYIKLILICSIKRCGLAYLIISKAFTTFDSIYNMETSYYLFRQIVYEKLLIFNTKVLYIILVPKTFFFIENTMI